MERLRLGNKYVHVVNLALFLMTTFWSLNFASPNLQKENLREFFRFSGIILSVCGLCSGGFWREDPDEGEIQRATGRLVLQETWHCRLCKMARVAGVLRLRKLAPVIPTISLKIGSMSCC